MGTWGVGTFENDGSYSFWEAFEENPLEEIVRIAKKYADMDTEDMDLDVEDAIEIQISALLTAGALGQILALIGRTQTEFHHIRNTPLADTGLDIVSAIKRALSLVILDPEKSELYELWEETDEGGEWLNSIRAFIAALEAEP
ncbi:hypothetical protein CAAN1_09S05248 [[Candida] anglica]